MAETGGTELVLGIIAVALAIWTQMLDSALEQASDFDGLSRYLLTVSVMVGASLLAAVFLGAFVAAFQAGPLGSVLMVVVLAAIAISLPAMVSLFAELFRTVDELEGRWQRFIAATVPIVVFGAVVFFISLAP